MERSKPRGFTLLEILVVVSIIVLLMALLMPVIAKVRSTSQRTATQTLMRNITLGLDLYYQEFDDYPVSNTEGLNGDVQEDSLFRALCGEDGRGVIKDKDQPAERRYSPFLADIPVDMQRQKEGKVVLIDKWSQPIHFHNCKQHILQKGDREICHNPNTFDMYSFGNDRVKAEFHDVPGTKPKDDDNKGGIDDAPEIYDDISNY